MKRTFETTIVRDGAMCFIPVPFDPRAVFGKVRAPVKVTLAGYTYRSTIASMGNGPCIPLRKSNREAAGLEGGETLRVTLELDGEKRTVEPPADLVRALKAARPAWQRWGELSYSHQREHVEAIEEAKKPETRARRIDKAVEMVAARPAKPGRARLTRRGGRRRAPAARRSSPRGARRRGSGRGPRDRRPARWASA
ncbi:MAG: YdeI/OmpD-associated family protein [Deltaproteobacteria bacterium]|nr:YdeI/OmpD-associated family protein [Kofleriaceae bacterium]